MSSTPQKSSQFVFGPSVVGGDMLQFRNASNTIVSWIDSTGTGQGNLANGTSVNFASNETPSGSTPGTSFTLAHAPVSNSLMLYWNGELLTVNIDYTLASNAISTVQTIQNSDIFVAFYRY